jgi:GT2 family glycosyltransferase
VTVPSVCAVVATYDRRDLVLQCLEALAAQGTALNRVLIVDNASSDGTEAAVAAGIVRARLNIGYITMEENVGAAGAVAEGVTEAVHEGHRWVWIIDSDCTPRPGALSTLLRSPEASDPNTAVLCTSLLSVDGHWQTEHRGLYTNGPRTGASPCSVTRFVACPTRRSGVTSTPSAT